MSDLIERIDGRLAIKQAPSELFLLEDCKAEIERLEDELAKAKQYVRFNKTEWTELIEQYSLHEHNTPWRIYIESSVMKRAGLTVKEKE